MTRVLKLTLALATLACSSGAHAQRNADWTIPLAPFRIADGSLPAYQGGSRVA